ncbi:LLM class flavin-dependent oxidoreductase [Nonomuraea typhae]|uniref:LLM class flavin-dependent oxidoreductase n=1 Tax=Nonomuraea typhae TaxID=2603600 RepID=UPI0012F7978E|nr:LLM class flavin-dependent oxidoreductase [Nonomuraea typhae]
MATGKPRLNDGLMRFGIMWPNTPSQNVMSRVVADRNPDVLDLDVHMELARTCERIGLDFAFFADSYTVNGPAGVAAGHGEPRLYAPIWAVAVIAATRRLGVVTTLHTRYLPAPVIARLGANLDAMSKGRWGWNMVPGVKPAEVALFGLEGELAHERRYDQAGQTLGAVKALWSAGAASMAGPAPVQRPHPVIFNPGVSPAGLDLIATECDYGFSAVVDDQAEVRSAVGRLAERAATAGRPDGEVALVGSIGVVLGSSAAEAEDKRAWFEANVDLPAAAGFAEFFMRSSQTYQELFKGQDTETVARKIGFGVGNTVLGGTAEQVAEQFIELSRATGMRHFLLLPFLWAPPEIEAYGEIFGHLRKAGVWLPPSDRGWSW